MARLAFPDWPMTAAEVRASLRGEEVGVKIRWEIKEKVITCNTVVVEAATEDEAWDALGRDDIISRKFDHEYTDDDDCEIKRLP